MVTNQDGLGTSSYPEEDFKIVQEKLLKTLANEGVDLDDILVDRSFPHENSPTRKPRTGLLHKYLDGSYDLASSFVIGDRATDIELAVNLGCKAILYSGDHPLNIPEPEFIKENCVLLTGNWDDIYTCVASPVRSAVVERNSRETQIRISLNLDGTGKTEVSTGLGFFDHMLEQIGRHSGCDLSVKTTGDLHVDEHHTIEDTAIVLGEAIAKALGTKKGIERYGFLLPMDDCLATVAVDFGGRSWIVWDVRFQREKVGDVPTELFFHFFKSFSDAARCNLYIKADGMNDHHKAESIFKAFAKALRNAVRKDPFNFELPSTKGIL
jgi:imidazoleglycerol-phosphate dehydratase / histidinol-phosphatase